MLYLDKLILTWFYQLALFVTDRLEVEWKEISQANSKDTICFSDFSQECTSPFLPLSTAFCKALWNESSLMDGSLWYPDYQPLPSHPTNRISTSHFITYPIPITDTHMHYQANSGFGEPYFWFIWSFGTKCFISSQISRCITFTAPWHHDLALGLCLLYTINCICCTLHWKQPV